MNIAGILTPVMPLITGMIDYPNREQLAIAVIPVPLRAIQVHNCKASTWKNYQARLLYVLLVFLCNPQTLAASSGISVADSAPIIIDTLDNTEVELTQTIVFALPEKPVIVERNNKGEIYRRGLSVAKVMFGEANVDWRPVYLPIRRMFSELANGNANFAYYVKNELTEACCITSEKPTFFIELGIFQAIGSPDFTQLADLKNRKVIVIEEYQYGLVGNFLHNKNNNITVYSAADHMTALSMLVAGRADYLLDYSAATTTIYEEAKRRNIVYTILQKIELYMLLNKDYPNAKGVIKRLERIYNRIPKDILNNPCVECAAGVREETVNNKGEP